MQKEVQKTMVESLDGVDSIVRERESEDECDIECASGDVPCENVQPSSAFANTSTSSKKRKECSNVRDPTDLLFNSNVQKMQQAMLNASNPIKQKLKMDAWKEYAEWSYECDIPFHAVCNPRFQRFIYAVGEYGRGMPAPSYHNVRVTLIKEVLKETNDFVDSFGPKWKDYGCSIMVDFWTDGKGRSLINFLVNCSQGTVFLKSIDASDKVHHAELIVEMINDVIEDVGEENIVQFITNNDSNFKSAGRKLMEQHPNMYWTPCAAYCINLMLQDLINDIDRIKNVLGQARSVVVYIYNHLLVLKMMRKLSKSELHIPCLTTSATSFYTLESIWKNKQYLQQLFVSSKWNQSSFSKRPNGKRIASIIARDTFWKNVEFACKVSVPLVYMLKWVDKEEQPCMGYIYDAMERAKLQLENNLVDDQRMLSKVLQIVEKRWVDQMSHHLHAAGYFLNPAIFYKHSASELNNSRRMLNQALERLVPDDNESDKIRLQLAEYRDEMGDFGTTAAKRMRETMSPYEWWMTHGNGTPELQNFARKVLSQTCSASPCERNWNAFENLHSKKRNCLLQAKLNDLVYIQYNMKLKRRFLEERKSKDKFFDPITLRDVDENDDWVTPTEDELEEFVRVGDDLTWAQVQTIMGGDQTQEVEGNKMLRIHSPHLMTTI